MFIGQPLPHHVHYAEVIPVKLAIMPAGINQNGAPCPDFSIRIKLEGPLLAVCPAQIVPEDQLFPVPGRRTPVDSQIRQIVFKMDLVLCKHIVNGKVSFVYMDIPTVGPEVRHVCTVRRAEVINGEITADQLLVS